MDNITILEGWELSSLLSALHYIVENTEDGVHTLRFNQREDGIAYKVNSGCWSPTVGRRADAGGY